MGARNKEDKWSNSAATEVIFGAIIAKTHKVSCYCLRSGKLAIVLLFLLTGWSRSCLLLRNARPLLFLWFCVSHASLASNSPNAVAGRSKLWQHQMHINLTQQLQRDSSSTEGSNRVRPALRSRLDGKADSGFYPTSTLSPGTAMIQAWFSGSTGPHPVRAACGEKVILSCIQGKSIGMNKSWGFHGVKKWMRLQSKSTWNRGMLSSACTNTQNRKSYTYSREVKRLNMRKNKAVYKYTEQAWRQPP